MQRAVVPRLSDQRAGHLRVYQQQLQLMKLPVCSTPWEDTGSVPWLRWYSVAQ